MHRRLEQLVARAYAEIHGVRRSGAVRLRPWHWFSVVLPQTFRRQSRAAGLARSAEIGPGDFEFRTGNNQNPDTWTFAPLLAGVTVRSPTRFTIRLPFSPSLALAASHWSTISEPPPGPITTPSGGSLNSKASLVIALFGESST